MRSGSGAVEPRRRWLRVFLIAWAHASSLGAAAQDPSTSEVLDRMARASERLRTLRAELVQEKSYPQLGISDAPETGTLILKRDGDRLRLRLDFTRPEPRTVVVDGRSYVYYQPRLKQAIVGSLEGMTSARGAGFLRYLLGDIDAREHRVERGGEIDDGTIHLTLRPRRPGEDAYRRVELWVDTKLWLPLRQVLVEPNDSVIEIRLESPDVGATLTDELFELALPPDVKRLKG